MKNKTPKIFPDDEGPLQMVLFIQTATHTDAKGKKTINRQIVLDFGKSIKWISVGKPEAKALIARLQEKVDEL